MRLLPKSAANRFLASVFALALAWLAAIIWVLISQNIENLSSEHGYDTLLSRNWRDIAAWMSENIFLLSLAASALAGGAVFTAIYAAIVDHEFRPLVRAAAIDLKDLAERAERLANDINRMLAERQTRPPTHPDFGGPGGPGDRLSNLDVEQWQRDSHNRREAAVRRYLSDYAAPAWAIIESAKKYVEVTDYEIMSIQHVSDHNIADVARLLARLAGRLRLIEPASSDAS